MEREELISVIVPVYNVEKYLDRCISSLIEQTYQYLEIILVDDGSTDNSGALCDLYMKKDKRISVVHKKNGGVSSARNVGLQIAKGEYISFIDADDYVTNDFYTKLQKAITEDKADLVVCPYERVKLNDLENEEISSEKTNKELEHCLMPEENIWKWSFVSPKDMGSGLCNKMFKSNIWKGIFFNENISMGEDNIALVEYLIKCKRISYINNKMYKYVINPYSATNTFISSEQLIEKIRIRFKATDIMNSLVAEENEIIRSCVMCRGIRDNLWAIFRMVVSGVYIKDFSKEIRKKTRQWLFSYIKVTEDVFVYKCSTIVMALSPYFLYILGRLFYVVMPKKMMNISKL